MWNDALVYIQEKDPKQVFETWFTSVVLDRIEDTTAYLAVPNKFFGEWLGEHYRDLLAAAVSVAQGGGHLDVSFVVNHKQAPSSSPAQQESGPADTAGRGFVASRSKRGVQLNPKYTFKSFVVGAGNQFAHAACMAVALFFMLFYATIVVGAFSKAWGADHSPTSKTSPISSSICVRVQRKALVCAWSMRASMRCSARVR